MDELKPEKSELRPEKDYLTPDRAETTPETVESSPEKDESSPTIDQVEPMCYYSIQLPEELLVGRTQPQPLVFTAQSDLIKVRVSQDVVNFQIPP